MIKTLDEMAGTLNLAELLIRNGYVTVHRTTDVILVNGRPLTDSDRELENVLEYMVEQGIADLEPRFKSRHSAVTWVEA